MIALNFRHLNERDLSIRTDTGEMQPTIMFLPATNEGKSATLAALGLGCGVIESKVIEAAISISPLLGYSSVRRERLASYGTD
jgi:hypothetical protein